jgi:hypothetical protein
LRLGEPHIGRCVGGVFLDGLDEEVATLIHTIQGELAPEIPPLYVGFISVWIDTGSIETISFRRIKPALDLLRDCKSNLTL